MTVRWKPHYGDDLKGRYVNETRASFDRAVRHRCLIVLRYRELKEFDMLVRPVVWSDSVRVIEIDEDGRAAFYLQLDPRAVISVREES